MMKRVSPFLWAMGAVCACPVAVIAQPAASVEEILVTGQGLEETLPLTLSRYGNRLEILTGETLAQGAFVDVSQALQMWVPGLSIAPKNGAFDYVDASLQGSRNQEILWLVDGVRITNRLYNGTSPLDTLPSHMVERVEVLKGGQGIFYGTQSVGGVINVVTKSLQQGHDGEVGVGMHSNEGRSVNAMVRQGNASHQFVLYGSSDTATGYRPYRREDIQPSATDTTRGYDVQVLGGKAAWALPGRGRLSFSYQRTDNTLDYLTPYANRKTVNAREEDIVTLKVDLPLGERSDVYVKAYYHDWDTRYTRIHNLVDASGALTGGIRVRDDHAFWGYEDYGVNAMLQSRLNPSFELLAGLDQQNFSGEDDVWRIADQKEKVTAAFAQLRTSEAYSTRRAFAFGVRRNHASHSEDSTVWNLSGQQALGEYFTLRGTAGSSFRLPDAESLFLNELYDEDTDGVPDGGYFAIGNPSLKPERSRNINLGLGMNTAQSSLELVAYARTIDDYIDAYVPVFVNGVEGEGFTNSDDTVEVKGLELIAGHQISPAWQLQASVSRTQAQFNGRGPQLTGIPRSEAKAALQYSNPQRPWGASLSMNYVGEVNARRGQTRGQYSVADLSAYVRFGPQAAHQVVLKFENLTDKVYTTRVDVGIRDTGGSYVYRNIGTPRTVHVQVRFRL